MRQSRSTKSKTGEILKALGAGCPELLTSPFQHAIASTSLHHCSFETARWIKPRCARGGGQPLTLSSASPPLRVKPVPSLSYLPQLETVLRRFEVGEVRRLSRGRRVSGAHLIMASPQTSGAVDQRPD